MSERWLHPAWFNSGYTLMRQFGWSEAWSHCPAEMRHFFGRRPSGRRVPGGGALDGQQLLVVEGSGWRGRQESVFCHRN